MHKPASYSRPVICSTVLSGSLQRSSSKEMMGTPHARVVTLADLYLEHSRVLEGFHECESSHWLGKLLIQSCQRLCVDPQKDGPPRHWSPMICARPTQPRSIRSLPVTLTLPFIGGSIVRSSRRRRPASNSQYCLLSLVQVRCFI